MKKLIAAVIRALALVITGVAAAGPQIGEMTKISTATNRVASDSTLDAIGVGLLPRRHDLLKKPRRKK